MTPLFGGLRPALALTDCAAFVLEYLRLAGAPERIRASLDAYAAGAMPVVGGFLTAVLENDLRRAVAHADPVDRVALPEIVAYCEQVLPPESWGSRAAVEAWERQHRPSAPPPAAPSLVAPSLVAPSLVAPSLAVPR